MTTRGLNFAYDYLTILLPVALLKRINEFTDLSGLWITCKRLWLGDERKEIMYIILRGSYAMKFAREKTFHNAVYSRVLYPSMQISLSLYGCSGVTDVSALGNVHTLIINDCHGVTDVSALGKVHTLYLSRCSGVTDVSALGKVHTLYLIGCSGVTDVSALGNVHTLTLWKCSGITDASALGKVHTLTLYGCNGLFVVRR